MLGENWPLFSTWFVLIVMSRWVIPCIGHGIRFLAYKRHAAVVGARAQGRWDEPKKQERKTDVSEFLPRALL